MTWSCYNHQKAKYLPFQVILWMWCSPHLPQLGRTCRTSSVQNTSEYFFTWLQQFSTHNDKKAEIWLLKNCHIWWNHLKSNKKYMILQIIIEFDHSFSTRDYLEAETLGREGGDCSSLASSCPLSLFSFKWELRCILYQGNYSEWFFIAGKQALKKTDQNLWWRPLESSLQ